jgi:MFS family permease
VFPESRRDAGRAGATTGGDLTELSRLLHLTFSDLILKKMRPSRWIPLIVICWGITQTLMGLVTNYTQLLSLRALLGFFECGLFPGLSFYLASWYPRKDLGLRIALFVSTFLDVEFTSLTV